MSGRVTVDLHDDAAWVTLDDGKVNALSTEMLGELHTALRSVAHRARVTVIRGRDGIFSAGFDLNTFRRGKRKEARLMLEAGVRAIVAIIDHPHPVVTVCTGHAYPMGAFLMLAADVRLGVAGNWRIGLNEVAIGLDVPDFALALARHRLTPAGYGLIPSGLMIGPDEAAAVGYLDEVVSPDGLDARVQETVAALKKVDLAAYASTKARVRGPMREAVVAAGLPF